MRCLKIWTRFIFGIFALIPHWASAQEMDEAWLHENLLFGPEVTFTNDILFDIPATVLGGHEPTEIIFDRDSLPQLEKPLIKAKLTKTQAREILRFLRDVLQVQGGALLISANKSRKGFWFGDGPSSVITDSTLSLPSRYQPDKTYSQSAKGINFVVTLADHTPVVVVVEHGAIEVNQSPQKLEDIGRAWRDIFYHAQQHGFIGSYRHADGDTDGGGGHINLGFVDPNHNPLLGRPDFLQNLLLLPLAYPGFMYVLSDRFDLGPFSNNHIPQDWTPEFQTDILSFLWQLDRWSSSSSTQPGDYEVWLKKNIPRALRDFSSYICLKNLASDEPRVELRFHRGLDTLADLQAIILLWFKSVQYLLRPEMGKFPIPNLKTNALETLPSQMILHFIEWMRQVGVPPRQQERLLYLNGDHSVDGLPIRHTRHSLLKTAVAYPMVTIKRHISVEVAIPLPQDLTVDRDTQVIVINGVAHQWGPPPPGKQELLSVILDASVFRKRSYLVTLTDEKQTQNFFTVVVSLIPDVHGGITVSLHPSASRFLHSPQRLYEMATSGSFWSVPNLLEKQFELIGISKAKLERLKEGLPRPAVTFTWNVAHEEADSDRLDDVDHLLINGQRVPHETQVLSHTHVFFIRDLPFPDTPKGYVLLMNAVDSKGKIVTHTYVQVLPLKDTLFPSYEFSPITLKDIHEFGFDPKTLHQLLAVPVGRGFNRRLFLQGLRHFWRWPARDTYAAMKRFERRLSRCRKSSSS